MLQGRSVTSPGTCIGNKAYTSDLARAMQGAATIALTSSLWLLNPGFSFSVEKDANADMLSLAPSGQSSMLSGGSLASCSTKASCVSTSALSAPQAYMPPWLFSPLKQSQAYRCVVVVEVKLPLYTGTTWDRWDQYRMWAFKLIHGNWANADYPDFTIFSFRELTNALGDLNATIIQADEQMGFIVAQIPYSGMKLDYRTVDFATFLIISVLSKNTVLIMKRNKWMNNKLFYRWERHRWSPISLQRWADGALQVSGKVWALECLLDTHVSTFMLLACLPCNMI